jgi:hypothetical protein
MKYTFEKVIDGLARWIDDEIFPKMNDVQELIARMFIGRVVENTENIKKSFVENGIIRTFGVVDSDGMVDVDALVADLKREIARKGKIVIHIPMFGKITFVPEDIDGL